MMTKNQGRTVRLFLVEGNTTGLITAEIMNWTGHALVAPRQSLAAILRRDEVTRTGVYFLVGEDPSQPSRQRVYVGEGDTVGDRIKAHAGDESKDFWTHCCLITSKDPNITKSHVRYLESRLIEIVLQADRANLSNSNQPSVKSLPESDIADMEFFLEQIELVLPVVGFDFLRRPPTARHDAAQLAIPARQSDPSPDSDSPIALAMARAEKGVLATALLWGGELVVQQGSTATTSSFASNSYAGQRQELIDDGRLKLNHDQYVFTQDVSFASPSAAAAVILNRNSNGRTEWTLKESGRTLKEWQDSQLQAQSIA